MTYLMTTDPDVLETVAANWSAGDRFRALLKEWAEPRTEKTSIPISTFGGVFRALGLPEQPTGFGRWTKVNHRGICRPFKSNTVECEALEAVRVQLAPYPGMPEMVVSERGPGDGSRYWMTPKPFVHNGAAWVNFAHQPEVGTEFGVQWVECLASEYHKAREEHEAAIRALDVEEKAAQA